MLVSWFKDGRELEQTEMVKMTRLDSVTSVLAISILDRDMAGNYSCVAKNEVAVVEVTSVLLVRGDVGQQHIQFVFMLHHTSTFLFQFLSRRENWQLGNFINKFHF